MADTKLTKSVLYDALSNVMDPELMMPITDLGLVYRAEILEDRVEVDFTLTYPGCPLGDVIEKSIKTELANVAGDLAVLAKLVWNPPWKPDFMSEAARLSMGYPI